jgi:hypothetical protein
MLASICAAWPLVGNAQIAVTVEMPSSDRCDGRLLACFTLAIVKQAQTLVTQKNARRFHERASAFIGLVVAGAAPESELPFAAGHRQQQVAVHFGQAQLAPLGTGWR